MVAHGSKTNLWKDPMTNRNIQIFNLAYQYLIDILPPELKESDLKKYFVGDARSSSSLRDVFIQLIASAQNYQSMPNIIKFNERKQEIGQILMDYDYTKVGQFDSDKLYELFWDAFKFKNKDSSRNSWRKWSNAVIDSANFVSVFKDMDDFRHFVELFSYNIHTRIALPLYISTKIKGIGFALACDALKELGYTDYPKPDVHIIEICKELELSTNDPVSVFEAIVRMADDNKTTPYKVDKILWLISSGYFYHEEIHVGRNKSDFIKYVKDNLKREPK